MPKWKGKKCHKCKKKVSRNGKWEYGIGGFHQYCWQRWKRGKLRDKADKEWSKAVMRKYGEVCLITGDYANQSHHFFPKSGYPQLRYTVENGVPVSKKGHMIIERKNDPEAQQKIIRSRGKEWYDSLVEKSKEEIPPSRDIEYYEKQIERLQKI